MKEYKKDTGRRTPWFADLMGVSEPTFKAYLSGDRNPPLRRLMALCIGTGWDINWFRGHPGICPTEVTLFCKQFCSRLRLVKKHLDEGDAGKVHLSWADLGNFLLQGFITQGFVVEYTRKASGVMLFKLEKDSVMDFILLPEDNKFYGVIKHNDKVLSKLKLTRYVDCKKLIYKLNKLNNAS